MPLKRLRLETFRCLATVDIDLHPQRNYFFGPNGAGKTSLLEAVYLLGRGRSFRTRHTRRLVQWEADGFAIHGEVMAGDRARRVGIGFSEEGLALRLDGAAAPGMASLAALLPVHVIEPGVHQLVEGGPGFRRQFLDWGVFHVEPTYLSAWRRYRQALRQRNAALRSRAGTPLRPWTEALAEAGSAVHASRERYVSALQAALSPTAASLLDADVSIDYRPGWKRERELADALREAEESDRAAGTTQAGPHRADLIIRLAARGVKDEGSRGQQKLVAAALVVSQVKVFATHRDDAGALLVDDPAAELDRGALARLLAVLEALPVQLLMTSLSESALAPKPGFPVFHVERGEVAPVL